MSAFDTLIIGEVALDTNVDYDGTTVQAIGGAVYYSGFAAANIGHRTAVLPKADMTAEELRAAFAQAPNVTVYPLPSRASFVTTNVYQHDRPLPAGGDPGGGRRRLASGGTGEGGSAQ